MKIILLILLLTPIISFSQMDDKKFTEYLKVKFPMDSLGKDGFDWGYSDNFDNTFLFINDETLKKVLPHISFANCALAFPDCWGNITNSIVAYDEKNKILHVQESLMGLDVDPAFANLFKKIKIESPETLISISKLLFSTYTFGEIVEKGSTKHLKRFFTVHDGKTDHSMTFILDKDGYIIDIINKTYGY